MSANEVRTVRITHLEKRFGATRAVAGLDLELGTGVTGLLGPNGAGKTTLLRMIATVLAPDAGAYFECSEKIPRRVPVGSIRRNLGYLPQEPGFYRGFTGFEFVDYVAILKEMTEPRSRHDEVRRVLESVGLADQMHKRIRNLSGGMRRRVGIAQALLGEPDLLVLDEPTAGLDPEQRLRFRELLTGRAEDRTILLSTHQTDDVAALCRRVIVFGAGSVRFDGTPRALAEQARGRVWSAGERDPRAALSWVTGEGLVRHIGDAPPGAALVEPTVEDGYLMLLDDAAPAEAVA